MKETINKTIEVKYEHVELNDVSFKLACAIDELKQTSTLIDNSGLDIYLSLTGLQVNYEPETLLLFIAIDYSLHFEDDEERAFNELERAFGLL